MIYFVDASALVKLYHEEIGTGTMLELIDGPERVDKFYISDHVSLEVIVRLNKVRRTLPRAERRRLRSALASFNTDRSRALHVLPVEPELIASAESLASTFADSGAGTLDLIHLASAFRVQRNFPGESLVFIASDHKLRHVARRADLLTFDPERQQPRELTG